MKQLKTWSTEAFPFLKEGANISEFVELAKSTFKLDSLNIYKVHGEQILSLLNGEILDFPEIIKNSKENIFKTKDLGLNESYPLSSEIFSFKGNDQSLYFVFFKGKMKAKDLLPILLPYFSNLTYNRNLNQDDFLSRLSHEIRTPLNAIMGGFVSLQEEPLSEKAKTSLHHGYKSATALLNSLDNILLYTQEDLKANLQNISLKSFLSEAISEHLELFKSKHINFDLVNESGRETIASDPGKIKKIISSFLENAARFSPEQGRVRFKCFDSGDYVVLQVQDNGVGFSSSLIEQVSHKAFIQEESYTTRTKGGNGLSLHLCFKIAKSLGAKIHIESTKNHGSLVSLRLPTHLEADFEPCSHFEGRLLLAEDDLTNQIVIRRYLEKLGFEVVTAENGQAAVEAYQNNPNFCAILMDCQMPVMDGFEATKKIKEINPSQVIIACTAHAFKDAETKCLESGMDAFVAKPVSLESLKHVLSNQIPQYGDHFDDHLVREVVEGEDDPMEGINFIENVLLKTFKEGVNSNLTLIETEKNPENLRKIFHKLKSSYGQLGFIKSQKYFAKLQKAESFTGEEIHIIKKQTLADIETMENWLEKQKKKSA